MGRKSAKTTDPAEECNSARIEGERARLRAIVGALPEALLLVDPATMRFIEANPAALRLLGCPREGLHELDVGRALRGVDWQQLTQAKSEPQSPDHRIIPVTVCPRTGKQSDFQARVAPVEIEGNIHLLFVLYEVENAAPVDPPAGRDSLTGLPDRGIFHRRLASAVRRARREPGALFAVLFLDLDHFKRVNDTHGHLVGDRLLEQVAHRLRQGVRPGDTVARWGGDEFILLVDGLRVPADALHVAERILTLVAEPVVLDPERPLHITASIGIATSRPEAVHPPETLLDEADRAMYRAKALGRARSVLSDPKPLSHPAGEDGGEAGG